MDRAQADSLLRDERSVAVRRVVIAVSAFAFAGGTAAALSSNSMAVLAAALILGWTQLAGL
jgi:hypothetical protein